MFKEKQPEKAEDPWGANLIPQMLMLWVCQDLDTPPWSKGKGREPPLTSTVMGTKLRADVFRSHQLDGVIFAGKPYGEGKKILAYNQIPCQALFLIDSQSQDRFAPCAGCSRGSGSVQWA